MEPEEIITGCIRHDRKAQQRLYDLYYDSMMRVALFYCKNEADAENVMIESFMSVFKNIASFKGESLLKTWIRKIVVNRSISMYNKNIKRRNREMSVESSNHSYSIADRFDLIGKMEADYILKLVQDLPDTERIVFNLYVIEGYSHNEIAGKMNFTDSTSRWYYANARKRLQERLMPTTLTKID